MKSPKSTKYYSFLDRWEKENNLLKALIVEAAKGSWVIPSIKSFILSEVVNGTIAHVGGKPGKVIYQDNRAMDDYEEQIYSYFKKETQKAKIKLPVAIGKTLDGMVKFYWDHGDVRDRPSQECRLYQYVLTTCKNLGDSRWDLPINLVEQVKKQISPSYSEKEREAISGIGKSMRPFVKEDLKFISKTYHW